jgi:hypothetical protein
VSRQDAFDALLVFSGQAIGPKVGPPPEPRVRRTAAQYNEHRRYQYATNPEYRAKAKKWARDGMIRLRYEAPEYQERIARYQEWVAIQGDRCAICGGTDPQIVTSTGLPRRLAIDHDHVTGVERGLLCSNCNVMLGTAQDDPERLEAGAAYLRRNRTQHNKDAGEAGA